MYIIYDSFNDCSAEAPKSTFATLRGSCLPAPTYRWPSFFVSCHFQPEYTISQNKMPSYTDIPPFSHLAPVYSLPYICPFLFELNPHWDFQDIFLNQICLLLLVDFSRPLTGISGLLCGGSRRLADRPEGGGRRGDQPQQEDQHGGPAQVVQREHGGGRGD